MKLSFLNFKTRSYLKRNPAIRSSLPYSQSINIGVLFTVEDKVKHDTIKDFVRRLEQDGKKVTVLSYLPEHKENYDFKYDFFTDKEISFWGSIHSNVVVKFSDAPFDFLFCVDATPNPMIMNLVARSKAKCRVGKFWEEKQGFFELMVDEKNGPKSLIDHMYKYAQITG